MSLTISLVSDVPFVEVEERFFNASFFSSGYERRARFVASKLSKHRMGRVTVLGFSDQRDDSERVANDRFFADAFGAEPQSADYDSDESVIFALEGVQGNRANECSILVDYTAMTRTWYAGILNWCRYSSRFRRVEVLFTYAVGAYGGNYPHRVITEMIAIPGCEGHPDPTNRSVAIFGLGHDGLAAWSILDDLEPDQTFGFIASPGVDADDVRRTLGQNEEFIAQLEGRIAAFPLLSAANVYGGLSELISPFVSRMNVILIPLGPKTHVLGAILCAMANSDVACLHARGGLSESISVGPQGTIAACKVVLTRND